jgi:hypothetical protein
MLRKGKKRIVIRFELNAASFFQDTPVAVQKASVGQPSRGMAALWPGIGKVQINACQFSLVEVLMHVVDIVHDKNNIIQPCLRGLFQGSQHVAASAFHRDIVTGGILFCKCQDELSPAAAELGIYFVPVLENLLPLSLSVPGIINQTLIMFSNFFFYILYFS